VRRDGTVCTVPAAELVPGDVMVTEEGERISADGRLLSGSVEIDASALTGESMPVARSADWINSGVSLLQALDLVFSGTTCTGGEATAVVVATGMHTELGRIAALSQRVEPEQSPLERQVRTVAWLIALIAVVMAAAFLPIATLGGGLTLRAALVLAVGLIAGNVPEGLLPVITLALAIGVRDLAQRGAVVKRLSAAETFGSTDVICTDKTGTLTENHMRVTSLWTLTGELTLTASLPSAPLGAGRSPALDALLPVMVACNNAHQDGAGQWVGDPTELALLEAADAMGVRLTEKERTAQRVGQFHFDPARKLMSTLDRRNGTLQVDVKGAPEALLSRCTTVMTANNGRAPLDDDARRAVSDQVDAYAAAGLRVLAFAVRPVADGTGVPSDRDEAERDLSLVGLAAMLDPPRPEVAEAVTRCHSAGIRIIVVTGDHPLTAAAVARSVGIGDHDAAVVTGAELDQMSDRQLDELLGAGTEVIFARTSPEAKLRIADALRSAGHIVAMTGDGVNDAPALRRADIGVAMGRGGTDVAREASTMVLTDDNFATIVVAVQAGRRIFDNIRKFIVYIFAHSTPEIAPYLVFALARGLVPLPLTVLQLLAFDVGTETLACARPRTRAGRARHHGAPSPAAKRRGHPPTHAAAGLALPRPHRRHAPNGSVLLRPHERRVASGERGRFRTPAPPCVSSGHHHDLPGHGHVSGRHGVRLPHRASLAALCRHCVEQAPAVGDRVHAHPRRRAHLRAGLPALARHRRPAPPPSSSHGALSRDRLGGRRTPATACPSPHEFISYLTVRSRKCRLAKIRRDRTTLPGGGRVGECIPVPETVRHLQSRSLKTPLWLMGARACAWPRRPSTGPGGSSRD